MSGTSETGGAAISNVTEDRLAAVSATIRTEIADLRAEMERRFAEQTRWIVGTGFAVGALIVAVVKL